MSESGLGNFETYGWWGVLASLLVGPLAIAGGAALGALYGKLVDKGLALLGSQELYPRLLAAGAGILGHPSVRALVDAVTALSAVRLPAARDPGVGVVTAQAGDRRGYFPPRRRSRKAGTAAVAVLTGSRPPSPTASRRR